MKPAQGPSLVPQVLVHWHHTFPLDDGTCTSFFMFPPSDLHTSFVPPSLCLVITCLFPCKVDLISFLAGGETRCFLSAWCCHTSAVTAPQEWFLISHASAGYDGSAWEGADHPSLARPWATSSRVRSMSTSARQPLTEAYCTYERSPHYVPGTTSPSRSRPTRRERQPGLLQRDGTPMKTGCKQRPPLLRRALTPNRWVSVLLES